MSDIHNHIVMQERRIAELEADLVEYRKMLRCTAGHVHNQPYGKRCPMCRLQEIQGVARELLTALEPLAKFSLSAVATNRRLNQNKKSVLSWPDEFAVGESSCGAKVTYGDARRAKPVYDRATDLLGPEKSAGTTAADLLRGVNEPLPEGCFCKPGKCMAPFVMGMQMPCRDVNKANAAPASAAESTKGDAT